MTPICRDWSERFPEAYDIELQGWINASKQGLVNSPTAWDGYVSAVTATAASRARDTGKVVKIEAEMLDQVKTLGFESIEGHAAVGPRLPTLIWTKW